jgi:hypothetical protein
LALFCKLFETLLVLDPQDSLVLLRSDIELFSSRQLLLQKLQQLELVDEVLQGHRRLSDDLVGGLLLDQLSPSRDIQLLLNIEEHLSLCMQLVAAPLGKPCLARGPNQLN